MIYTALVRDLSRRKKLEARLQQARKMESVGQMAAGIAHEINTPIQFIGSNIQFLQGGFDDLGELLDLFDQLTQAVKQGADTRELLDKIESQSELADLPFLREEFPGALAQSLDGIERVAAIVRTMKEFSQPSTDSQTAVDINGAIENMLVVSTKVYSDIAEIETSLDSHIPPLPCMKAKLNQVFLNLLSNAAEAIAEHRQPGEGRIQIATEMRTDEVEIRFSDNGPGIPEEIQSRIFDPFFTTKEVGKGMGQGLAFVYDVIVNKHSGGLRLTSSPEEGTTFFVTLPLPIQSTETNSCNSGQEYADTTR